MVPPLDIRKSRYLNLVLYIELTIYVRFGQSSDCLYICNGGENFIKTQLYFRMFGVTIADNKHIGIVENTFFKCPSI